MNLLHTSDWHLGRILHGMHLTSDQRDVLNQMKELLQKENIDALIIAGDIYDRSIPPVEAVELFHEFLEGVALELKIPIIAIAGNHDSPQRINFASRLLAQKSVYIIGKTEKGFEQIRLKDSNGPVNIFVVPYADPAYIRAILGDESISTHDQGMEAIISSIQKVINTKERNVFVGHAFVQGGTISESERPLSVGGADQVSYKHFEMFDYTALGHLHGPQKVGREYIRYAGSLMKYSQSEVNQKKGVYIVKLEDKGQIDIQKRSFVPKKDLREVRGSLRQVLDKGVQDPRKQDYIVALLEDEGALLDPMEQLRTVYPNVIGIRRLALESKTTTTLQEVRYDKQNQLSDMALFRSFYESVTNKEFGEKKEQMFQKIIDKGTN